MPHASLAEHSISRVHSIILLPPLRRSLTLSLPLSVSIVRAKSARRLSGAHTRIHAQACVSFSLPFAPSLSPSHAHWLSPRTPFVRFFLVPLHNRDFPAINWAIWARSLLGSASPLHCHELMRRAACREPLSVLAVNAFPASEPTNREIRACRGRDPINFAKAVRGIVAPHATNVRNTGFSLPRLVLLRCNSHSGRYRHCVYRSIIATRFARGSQG